MATYDYFLYSKYGNFCKIIPRIFFKNWTIHTWLFFREIRPQEKPIKINYKNKNKNKKPLVMFTGLVRYYEEYLEK
jgi:hypothetical protein